MRELKWRAWDKDNHRYAELREVRPVFEVEGGIITLYQGEQSAYIFEQFTGLRDKNGKEIYENDLIDCADWWRGVVCWQDDGAIGWCVEDKTHMATRRYGLNSHYTLEVIGNIHENPELLK